MAQTAAEQIANAEAENYWSMVARRNETQRAYRSRKLCCHCKTRPVESKSDSVLCKTDADYYRREFGQEP